MLNASRPAPCAGRFLWIGIPLDFPAPQSVTGVMKTKRPWDAATRALANHLFATATAILEDAVDTASAGQHPRLTATACRARAEQLLADVDALVALAGAVLVVAGNKRIRPRKPTNRR